MLLAHAVTLAEARSYIAALADEAATFDGSVEYEHALLYLDLIHGDEGERPRTWADLIHGDDVPALDTHGLTDDRAILHAVAVSAVKELADHGVDQLQVELLLDMLDVARDRDNPNPEASGF